MYMRCTSELKDKRFAPGKTLHYYANAGYAHRRGVHEQDYAFSQSTI